MSYNRERYENDPEYREKLREKQREYTRRWRANNPEKEREIKRKYYANKKATPEGWQLQTAETAFKELKEQWTNEPDEYLLNQDQSDQEYDRRIIESIKPLRKQNETHIHRIHSQQMR